ncbi:acetyltransferase [Rhizobium sp. Root149]|jgi:phosphinothricin acetyltransferase|uniref:Phosphinothricin acetyltransferase n=1 Tax=Rhizobium rhizoryzae TaxID=451876 RepID=A0A7W6LEN2_9HYPH|nr:MULTISPECIES: GNAT family N-acetyltransferase [Rhizobium]KQZ63146.1 acetyltransferase [Rhizobium sp. Root149]MBB4142787.1 phosphinothricin acetyltransferase [Rhizobium rhizoryzae]
MSAAPVIREATEADIPAILAIYNDAVANTTAIWNDNLVDLENRRQWYAVRKAKGFPVLVADRDGEVAGYAAYGEWRAFEGFRHTVEHSVYVHNQHRGAGIGRLLMTELVERAKAGGIHVMVGCIEAENKASIRLHEALGFRHVGTFAQVGVKFGRWLDLTCMELRTGSGDPG